MQEIDRRIYSTAEIYEEFVQKPCPTKVCRVPYLMGAKPCNRLCTAHLHLIEETIQSGVWDTIMPDKRILTENVIVVMC